MERHELGEIVAERQLELVGADGTRTPCTVQVGKPIQLDKEEWVRPYKIGTATYVFEFRMHGIDSVQALVLTLKTLDGEISRAAEKHKAEVRYLDGPHESVFSP